jgi:hypothetical protein
MTFSASASTAPALSERVVQGLIGFGGTDRETIRALLGPRQRPSPVSSGTAKMISIATLPAAARASAREGILENFPITGTDVGVLHWDGPRGLLMIHYASTADQRIPFRFDVPNSTDPSSQTSYFLQRQFYLAFAAAANEVFEDGIESQLTQILEQLLDAHGTVAVAMLEDLFFSSTVNPEVAVESLKWIGTVDHKESRSYRRRLLERCLQSASARIRYAAALALAAMDDPISLPALLSQGCSMLNRWGKVIFAKPYPKSW